MRFEDAVKMRFRCVKCRSSVAEVRKVAMTGTGLTKIFDIQSNEFYAVICENCGYTEFYERRVINRKKSVIGTSSMFYSVEKSRSLFWLMKAESLFTE